jgi:hypothetical protein
MPAEGSAMVIRRYRFCAELLAAATLPSAALAQTAAAPLNWHMVLDRATYLLAGMDPPTLPAPPGRIAVHYLWEEHDKIEDWWEQVLSGTSEAKHVILFVKRGHEKKAIISYALDGVQLRDFHGPALSRDGGYSGPSTAVLSFQTVRVLPK